MPGFVTVAGHECRCTDDVTDGTFVNELTAGLDAGTHVGIGCAADPKTLFFCDTNEFQTLFPRSAERLFGVNGLACEKRCLGNFKMLVGTGDVEDEVNIGIGKHIMHRFVQLGNVVLFNRTFCAFADQIADTDDFDVLKLVGNIFQIDAGNGTDTDNTDSCHDKFSLY